MRKLLLLLVTILFLVGCTRNTQNAPNSQKDEKMRLLEVQLLSYSDSIQLLKTRLNELEQQTAECDTWFSDLDKEFLQKKGINNPEEAIIKDLFKRRELIKKDAVLGGRMEFEKAQLIGNKWAIAYGSDGHVEVRYLLRYFISKKDKSIKWTVISSDK